MQFEDFINKLGIRIREIRHERNLSQLDLSVKSGVPKETISKIENGVRPPKLETLVKLAEAFEVKVGDLFGFEGE